MKQLGLNYKRLLLLIGGFLLFAFLMWTRVFR